MVIYPINTEAFFFNELSNNAKKRVIENKITHIIANLDNIKYKKYLETINLAKKSNNPLNYREFIKKHNLNDLIKDLINEDRLYDSNGNMFNIIFKNGEPLLFLTKETFIKVKLIKLESRNKNKLNISNKNIIQEFTISKFNKKNKDLKVNSQNIK